MTRDHSDPGPEAQEAAGGTGDAAEAGTDGRAGAAGGDADSPETLMLNLQDARAKADEYWNELLRARAELTNIQRRAERDVANAHRYGLERFAGELLPVLDSLELGLNAAGEGGASDPEKLREGMDLTLKLLLTVAGKYGITPVDPAGEKFNPELHQAMATQPAPGVAPNTVVAVYQKGWRLNDRLLRPAMVVVAANDDGSAGGNGSAGRVDETA